MEYQTLQNQSWEILQSDNIIFSVQKFVSYRRDKSIDHLFIVKNCLKLVDGTVACKCISINLPMLGSHRHDMFTALMPWFQKMTNYVHHYR